MSKVFIVDQFPAGYASGVYINDRVWAQFSVPISIESATYYNFTVNEKNTYEPVEGTVSVQGVSGSINDAVIIFTPYQAFKTNTDYSVLVSTGIKAKATDDYLADDTVWYFTTGNIAASGLIGSENIIIPSGVTDAELLEDLYGPQPGKDPFAVIESVPEKYAYNVETNIPFIAIRFNAPIPSGINIGDYIKLSSRRILG